MKTTQDIKFIIDNNKNIDLNKKWYSEEELKEILDNWNCHNEEIRKTINSIKLRLRLE